MGVHESIGLVDDEQAKRRERQGISPELPAQQSSHQENPDHAVADQVRAEECPGVRGVLADGAAEKLREPVVGILVKLGCRKKKNDGLQRSRLDKDSDDAA